ncbi:hypothetical protein OS493_013014 [Desmophyllum pertusum]|uniref:SET domain-containing protein 9 n=1 Tax=Desmophyllum pertusum TaxID=174260 RepID=A0A9X0CS29_9CNID|nr:hypothetical protein OS493_013014 [Desmophyllum pertusum]
MGALVARQLVNWQSLQERLDLFAIYRLIQLYEQNIGPSPVCSYEKQYLEVHRSIEEQLEDCLGDLHKQVQQNIDEFCHWPFSLSIQKSSIHHPLAGNGVFLKGSAVPGSFITFHPGLVYLAKDVRKMPNYPNISKDNCYLMSRYDGCLLNAKDFDTDIQLPCGKRSTHPFAFGHMINHPPPGSKPNVMPFNYDIMESFQSDLVYLVPNRYFRLPGILYKTAAVMRTILFVATEHINNEELFVNYRMNPSAELPDWYTPVDLEQDKRRWNAG